MEIKVSKIIRDLVKEYPNDYDLGEKVRQLILRLEKISNESKKNKNKNNISSKEINFNMNYGK